MYPSVAMEKAGQAKNEGNDELIRLMAGRGREREVSVEAKSSIKSRGGESD